MDTVYQRTLSIHHVNTSYQHCHVLTILQSYWYYPLSIILCIIAVHSSGAPGKTLALVNAHLAAHVGKVKERNAGDQNPSLSPSLLVAIRPFMLILLTPTLSPPLPPPTPSDYRRIMSSIITRTTLSPLNPPSQPTFPQPTILSSLPPPPPPPHTHTHPQIIVASCRRSSHALSPAGSTNPPYNTTRSPLPPIPPGGRGSKNPGEKIPPPLVALTLCRWGRNTTNLPGNLARRCLMRGLGRIYGHNISRGWTRWNMP